MVVLPIMAVSALIVISCFIISTGEDYADDFVADVGYGVVGPGTVQVLSGTLPSQFRCLVEERCGVARQLEDAIRGWLAAAAPLIGEGLLFAECLKLFNYECLRFTFLN